MSLYDCDDGVVSVEVGAGQARLLAEGHEMPLDTVEEEQQLTVSDGRIKSSWFDRVFGRRKRYEISPEEFPVCIEGEEEEEDIDKDAYRGPVDVDALLDDLARSVTPDADCVLDVGRAVSPSAASGMPYPDGECIGRAAAAHPSSTLRFFSAREGRAGPHTDVEASLRPFDECSEYSASAAPHEAGREVESQYFFGNKVNGDENDRLPLTSHEGPRSKRANPGQTRLVRRFGNMLHRLSSRDEGEKARPQRTRARGDDDERR